MAEDEDPDVTWTVALAGGDGSRLAELVEQRAGRKLPKQYAALFGPHSLLEDTIDRLDRITRPEHVFAVIGADHGALAGPQLLGRCDHVLREPSPRGTGMAAYIALAMIKRYTPNAVVTITPSCHYVAPVARFVEHVRISRTLAAKLRDRVVTLGQPSPDVDPGLGYLELGGRLVEVPEARRLVRYTEPATVADAAARRDAGALRSTLVASGTVDAFWELGRAAIEPVIEVLEALVPLVGTVDEDDALEYIYRTYPSIDLARDVLAVAPDRFAVLELEDLVWSDCATPAQLARLAAWRATA